MSRMSSACECLLHSCQWSFLFVLLSYKYLYCGTVFYIWWLFANLFYLLEFTENSKKEKSTTRSTYCFISYFGTSWSLFVFCFLHPCLYVIYLFSLDKHVDSKWYDTKWSDFIDIRSLKKEFRGNWGAILDFPGVPDENES